MFGGGFGVLLVLEVFFFFFFVCFSPACLGSFFPGSHGRQRKPSNSEERRAAEKVTWLWIRACDFMVWWCQGHYQWDYNLVIGDPRWVRTGMTDSKGLVATWPPTGIVDQTHTEGIWMNEGASHTFSPHDMEGIIESKASRNWWCLSSFRYSIFSMRFGVDECTIWRLNFFQAQVVTMAVIPVILQVPGRIAGLESIPRNASAAKCSLFICYYCYLRMA